MPQFARTRKGNGDLPGFMESRTHNSNMKLAHEHGAKHLGYVWETLMKLQSNRKNWVAELGLIVRCKPLEIYWTSVVLWILVLWIKSLHGISIMITSYFGRDWIGQLQLTSGFLCFRIHKFIILMLPLRIISLC